MTERNMTAILALAMRGNPGEALRMYLGMKMGEVTNTIAMCNGENAAFLAGVLRGIQIIAQGLEGMEVADKMMSEE